MKIGSLFSGYGGLTMAVEAVFGGDLAWVADISPGARKVLAERFPDVPNLGDLTAVDWSSVPPVDVIEGGSPCQDLSVSGRRAGMTGSTRSGLWESMRRAIETLRPQWVIWENVEGALSARAYSDVESEPGLLGNRHGRPAITAAGRVVGDLASLGYDCRWQVVSAADLGAPHLRKRIFIVARDAAHAASVDAALRERLERSSQSGAAAHGETLCSRAASHADDLSWVNAPRQQPACNHRLPHGSADRIDYQADWGRFAPAIARWAEVMGPPPPPVVGPRGGVRLSLPFVEWMMGLPAGHVCAVEGLTNLDKLQLLGNGVVPQQATCAIRRLVADHLAVEGVAA